jgi:hypothetical protein
MPSATSWAKGPPCWWSARFPRGTAAIDATCEAGPGVPTAAEYRTTAGTSDHPASTTASLKCSTRCTARGIALGILSNKPHEMTLQCVQGYLDRWSFGVILGQRDHVARKPDPAGALEAAAALRVAPGGRALSRRHRHRHANRARCGHVRGRRSLGLSSRIRTTRTRRPCHRASSGRCPETDREGLTIEDTEAHRGCSGVATSANLRVLCGSSAYRSHQSRTSVARSRKVRGVMPGCSEVAHAMADDSSARPWVPPTFAVFRLTLMGGQPKK